MQDSTAALLHLVFNSTDLMLKNHKKEFKKGDRLQVVTLDNSDGKRTLSLNECDSMQILKRNAMNEVPLNWDTNWSGCTTAMLNRHWSRVTTNHKRRDSCLLLTDRHNNVNTWSEVHQTKKYTKNEYKEKQIMNTHYLQWSIAGYRGSAQST